MNTTGIMFVGNYREGYGVTPTVADAVDGYDAAWAESHGSWLVVAYDPRGLRYADQDTEAMNETNFAAILAELCVEPKDLPRWDRYAVGIMGTDAERKARWDAYEAAFNEEVSAVGCFLVDLSLKGWHSSAKVLVVNGEHAVNGDEDNTAADVVADLLDRIQSYPLLDEDAYSAREYDAWCEYAPMAWRDEVRDIINAVDADADVPMAVALRYADIIDNVPMDLVWEAQSGLHYYYGFSGDYYPKFAQIIRDTMGCDASAAWVGDMATRMRGALGDSAVRVAEVLTVLDKYASAVR